MAARETARTGRPRAARPKPFSQNHGTRRDVTGLGHTSWDAASLSRILAYSNRPLDLLQGSEHGRVHFPEAALWRPLSGAAPRFKPTESCRIARQVVGICPEHAWERAQLTRVPDTSAARRRRGRHGGSFRGGGASSCWREASRCASSTLYCTLACYTLS